MSLAQDLEIYKAADQLLALALQVQANINPAKTILQPIERGVDFVGHVIKPWHTTTRKRTVQRALHRIATADAGDTWAQGSSYLGLIGQTTHPHTQRAHIANALRRRGHAVAGDLSKIYHRPQPCKNSTP